LRGDQGTFQPVATHKVREAIVKYGQNKSRAAVQARRKASLTWVDMLVVAAVILTAAAIIDTTVARAKAAPSPSTGISWETGNLLNDDPGLVRARVRLATGT
jgi:hypothetical protein